MAQIQIVSVYCFYFLDSYALKLRFISIFAKMLNHVKVQINLIYLCIQFEEDG